MQIDKQLYDEINEYCKLNSLKTRNFIHKILRDAFNKEKFGDSPFAFNKKNETVDVEPTDKIMEEKVTTPELDKKTLDLSINVFKNTIGSEICPVQAIPLPDKETQIEEKKEEIHKPKKKRTLN